MRPLTLLIALSVSATVCSAQDEAALHSTMKQIGPLAGGLGKKIAAKDASASADAEKLESLFVEVRKLWESRVASDSADFSKNASEQFNQVAKAITAGQWDDAAAAQKKAGASCMGCHSAHREKAADGTYKLK